MDLLFPKVRKNESKIISTRNISLDEDQIPHIFIITPVFFSLHMTTYFLIALLLFRFFDVCYLFFIVVISKSTKDNKSNVVLSVFRCCGI
jgi:hypothetical protein